MKLLFVRDASGASASASITAPLLSSLHMEEAFGRLLVAPFTIVAAEGRFGPLSVLARRLRGGYLDVRRGKPLTRAAGTEAAEAFRRSFRTWIRRFNGVATRYLPNYLAWQRTLDCQGPRCFALGVLRWPALPSTA